MSYALQPYTIIQVAEKAICEEIPKIVERGSDRVLNGLITTLTTAMKDRYNTILDNRLREIETQAQKEFFEKIKTGIDTIVKSSAQQVIAEAIDGGTKGGKSRKNRNKKTRHITSKSRKTKRKLYKYNKK